MQILQFFSSSLGRNPRPTRFNALLSEFGKVTVCSAPPEDNFVGDIEFIQLAPVFSAPSFKRKLFQATKLFLRFYEHILWSKERKDNLCVLQERTFSLIVCQDILLLPLALAVKNLPQNRGNCRLIMDIREFFPRLRENSLYWRLCWRGLMDYICKKYLPQADVVFTVSPGLAQGYKDEYGVDCIVLPSLSYYDENINPHATAPNLIRCIHHGDAIPVRKLEYMIEGFIPLKGKCTFDLMLMPNNVPYYKKLQKLTEPHEHINFIPTVPMPDIVSFISQYDVGVYLSVQDTFNEKYAWPNKFFEFIQARLALVVSPAPDMADLVKEKQLGVVTKDYTSESLMQAMLSCTPEMIDAFKNNSHEAAKELCWEKNDEIIREIIVKLTQLRLE